MGWKAMKEAYGITHIVHAHNDVVYIGSPMVSELAWVDARTGEVGQNMTFSLLDKAYPELLKARPEELLALLEKEDEFSASIPVFTYEGGQIIEKFCEELGFPNVTHDGDIMYDNTFSTDKGRIIQRAKYIAQLNVDSTRDAIERQKRDLEELQEQLEKDLADLVALQAIR